MSGCQVSSGQGHRLILSVMLVLCLVFQVQADTLLGKVIDVADGDRITVLDADKVQHKIRLAGIDAPEKKQAFGNRSKESLSDLVFDRTVNVETEKRDRYGRKIGKVLVNGQDVNLVQVDRRMAWFYREYQREQSPSDRKLYMRRKMRPKLVGAACGVTLILYRH